MKKLLFITLGLAAVFSLTSCVESQQVNPNFDPNTNTVNTQFVLNIAAAEGDPLTKQSASAVQIETTFLGMDNATLFVFNEDKDGEKLLTPKEGSAFDLSTVLDKGVITNTNSRRILELPLPLGVNTMIFYGMATKGDRSDEEAGSTKYIYPDKNLKHIGSYAVARLPQGSTAASVFNQTRGWMLAVLNSMFKLGMGGSSVLDSTKIKIDKYKNKTVHWQDYLKAIDETNPRSPLNESANPAALEIVLGNTFDALTNIPGSEARSGSGPDIASQVAGLLYLCSDASTATPLDDEEAVAIQFFTVLESYLKTFFDSTPNWKSVSEVANGFSKWGITPGYNNPPDSVDFNAFPASFKLPVGVAILKKGSTDPYRQLTYSDSPEGTDASGSTIYDVTYPPQLCYYANSPLYISESNDLDDPQHKHTYPGYPNTVGNWSDLSSWTSGTCAGKWETDGSGKVKYGHITTSTRGVAMAFNVQYGQAILATTVKIKDELAGSGGYVLIDNNAGIPGHTGQSDQTIIVTDSEPLVLTGIIVGGQPSVANWQYLPWYSVETDLAGVTLPAGEQIPEFSMNKMVYDSSIYPQTYAASGFKGAKIPMSGNNYTVLHDNYNFDNPNNQDSVFVALQFLNMTGKDFWGKDNMIRSGGTFYLLLNLEAPQNWPSTIALDTDEQNMMPPYDNEGKTSKKPRVFMADTRTNLTVTLSKDALKSAVVTIPDLRAAKMSFGLSVDLVWKTGASYEIPIGTVTGN